MDAAETANQNMPDEYEACESKGAGEAVARNYRFINVTLNVIGGKWTILILRDLFTGPKRFGEILKSMERVSPKTLSTRLRELEEEGIVNRIVFPVIPPHVEYSLTEKGRSLKPILDKMSDWGAEWHPEV